MSYNGLTNQGLEYLTRCQVESKPVVFSKVKIGNGSIPMGSTGETTTDLYSFKKEIEILNKEQVENSIKMEILISNFDVLEEFYVKEIGVYVMDNDVEKLYWYINKDRPSPLPDKNTPAKHKYILHLETSQMESIILNYTGADLLVDKEFVEEKLNEVKDRTKALQFSDIESMKQKNLKVGDIVEVLGYYTAGDGAGHKRIIANEDDRSGVQLTNRLWANIVHNGEVNVSWFGAKGDGVTDDTQAIQKALNLKCDIMISDGTYIISNSLIFESEQNHLYEGKGYKTRELKLSKTAIIKINTNNHCLVLRGSNLKISGGTLTFTVENYDKDLLRVEALNTNKIKITCNNIIENLSLINEFNPARLPNGTDFQGNGIHLVSDGANAIYSNKIRDCYISDLHYGLLIENNSTAGINGNTFDLSIWNCNCLCKTNGSGNIFTGNLQSGRPGVNGELSAIECIGSYNIFLWYVWDVGQFPSTNKYLYNFSEKSINNYVSQNCFGRTLKGAFYKNKLNLGIGENYLERYDVNLNAVPFNLFNDSYYLDNISKDMSQSKNSLANFDYIESIIPEYTNLESPLKNSISDVYKLDSSYMPLDLKPLISLQKKVPVFSKKIKSEKAILKLNINIKSKTNSLWLDEIALCFQNNMKSLNKTNISVKAIFENINLGEKILQEKYYKTESIRSFYRRFSLIENNDSMQKAYLSNLQKIEIVIELPAELNTEIRLNKIFGSMADMYLGYIENHYIKDSTSQISQLNTIYHLEKMKQENVYDDYIAYNDEKFAYDKQQKKLEEQRQLAYQEALKENPNLTYEEFMSLQPMTLNLIEEPQPSARLQEFMDKYL